MRFFLFLVFVTLSLSASAQFWKRKHKPAPEVLSLAPVSYQIQIKDNPPAKLEVVKIPRSVYDLEIEEASILKEAKHNMRFRIYDQASYNFTDLAILYLKQNRFSEAKWYLLQSNNIAKQAGNARHVLDNLYLLTDIKVSIGELTLAMADLLEAHDLAVSKGMQTDVALVNKKIKFLQTNKIVAVKAELRYAEAVEAANAKTVVN
ncbi:hypothetical protein ACFS5N_08180 [Mucilaginibacter ximonensis]|uniref:MalT-like TPR region domain-containing protein n=1 Tax=Mucilaginibacter ximonensis TaxID=538021 RepID=A0ABW5YAY6_9SPHI